MTIQGAIEDIKQFEIPFYQESSRQKVIETIESYKQEIRAEERAKTIAEISREIRLLYANEYEQQIIAEVVDEFVKWAYIHGIDFSFMGKIKEDGKSDVPKRLQNIKDRFYNELKEQNKI